jgi:hypothetical protein
MKAPPSLFAGFIAVCVILAITGGLSIMDSPEIARFKKLDEKRLRDLQGLSNAINGFRGKTHNLPETLEQLAQDQNWVTLKLHDDAQHPYDYLVKDDASYELCARFDAASEGRGYNYGGVGSGKHPAGRYCFSFSTAR